MSQTAYETWKAEYEANAVETVTGQFPLELVDYADLTQSQKDAWQYAVDQAPNQPEGYFDGTGVGAYRLYWEGCGGKGIQTNTGMKRVQLPDFGALPKANKDAWALLEAPPVVPPAVATHDCSAIPDPVPEGDTLYLEGTCEISIFGGAFLPTSYAGSGTSLVGGRPRAEVMAEAGARASETVGATSEVSGTDLLIVGFTEGVITHQNMVATVTRHIFGAPQPPTTIDPQLITLSVAEYSPDQFGYAKNVSPDGGAVDPTNMDAPYNPGALLAGINIQNASTATPSIVLAYELKGGQTVAAGQMAVLTAGATSVTVSLSNNSLTDMRFSLNADAAAKAFADVIAAAVNTDIEVSIEFTTA